MKFSPTATVIAMLGVSLALSIRARSKMWLLVVACEEISFQPILKTSCMNMHMFILYTHDT